MRCNQLIPGAAPAGIDVARIDRHDRRLVDRHGRRHPPMPSGAGSDESCRPRAPAWDLPRREHRLPLPAGCPGQGQCSPRRAERGGAGTSRPRSISEPLSTRAVQAGRADTGVRTGGQPLTDSGGGGLRPFKLSASRRRCRLWPSARSEMVTSARHVGRAVRSSSAMRLTSVASTWPLCVFMMSPTRRPTCLASVIPSAARRSRTSAPRAASSSPFGR